MIKLLIAATLLEALLYAGMAVWFFLDDQPAPGAVSSAVTRKKKKGGEQDD